MPFHISSDPTNKVLARKVECLLVPALHVEDEDVLNFITDSFVMLDSAEPKINNRHRRFLEHSLARRVKLLDAGHVKTWVRMSDNQWRHWRDIRSMFQAMRNAHERRAALPRITSPAPAGPLFIPLPEAAA